MTQEEKDLLLKDICSRVSNGGYVKVSVESTAGFDKDCVIVDIHNLSNFVETTDFHLENVKIYLRPMSSMTEEEWTEYEDMCDSFRGEEFYKLIDWANKNMLDYRGLIPLGLALPATEEMYNIK